MLKEVNFINNGVQKVYEFDNGYGASVIMGPYTYGGPKGLWELAVLAGGELCYDTHITNDVIGRLNEAEVNNYLNLIKEL